MSKKTLQPTSISVTSIQLDPENPRLTKKDSPYSQPEIIAELLNHSEIEKIAKSISEIGYFPMENIICYKNKSDGKVYVVEGNRRICACKLLLSPESAPGSYQKKYKTLSKNLDFNSIKKVSVVMVDDRVDAYPMMVSKHTKSLTKDWEPVMQAEFYLSVINEGYDVDGAAGLLNINPGDIRSSLSLLHLYNAAQKLEMDESLKKIVNDPYKFELSTFKRVITNKKAKEKLYITTKDDGNVTIGMKSDEFVPAFKKIVEDIASGEKNSRNLNKSDEIEDYFNDLQKEKVLPKTPTKVKEQKLADIISVVSKKEDEKKKKKKNAPLPTNVASIKRTGIVTSDVKCEHQNKVGDVFLELKKLDPKKTPNSCAMTLRMLLELGTYTFLKQSGEYDKLQKKLAGVNGNPSKLPSAELKQMLSHIVKENLLSDTQLTKALDAFINDKSTSPIISALNQFVHNVHWKANEEKLVNIWDDLKEYFKIVLKK